MLGNYHFGGQNSVSERGYSAKAIVLDSVGFETFNKPVYCAICQLLKKELLAVGMGKIIETDMYFINAAD